MEDAPSLGSCRTVTSTAQFGEFNDFKHRILSSLSLAKEYHEFVFTHVPPSWAESIFQLIDEKIPSRKCYNATLRTLQIEVKLPWILNSIQSWLADQKLDWLLSNQITEQEGLLLQGGVGTTLEFKNGPYRGSWKEPDFYFQVNDHILPTLAVESGWSESKEQLHDDMNLLLVGGNGSIKIVIIVEWTMLRFGRVSGIVGLFARDRSTGMPRLEQRETVFPRPSNNASNQNQNQRLGIKRSDLFGDSYSSLPPNREKRNDLLFLDVERLRDHAARALRRMDLRPA